MPIQNRSFKITPLLFSIFLYIFIFSLFTTNNVKAQTCSCPNNWYVCDGGTKCCWGEGCPSFACGTCPGGWTASSVEQRAGEPTYYSYCPSTGATCGGSCNGCGASIPEPISRNIPGYVYTDINVNNQPDSTDRVWYRSGADLAYTSGGLNYNCGVSGSAPPAYVPFTGPRQASSTLAVSPGGGTWSCWQSDPEVIYRLANPLVPAYKINGLWTSSSYAVSITLPTGLTCENVGWRWTTCSNRHCDSLGPPVSRYGTGCTFIMSPGRYRNQIDWKIPVVPSVLPRTVQGTIFQTTSPTTCTNNGVIALPGLTAAIYNATALTKSAPVNATNGTYSISSLSSDRFDSLCINGNLSTTDAGYQLACVRASASNGASYSCTRGSGACAIVCTPNTILATSPSVTINLGFTRVTNDKWISILDGDFYSSSVNQYVANTPGGAFTPNIINTLTATSKGGYGFAGTAINTQTTLSNVSESGGAARNLTRSITNFESGWLNKFTFTPPSGAITTPPAGNNFLSGRVYSLTAAQFNTILTTGTYTISTSNEVLAETAIVYINGGGIININNPFTTDSPNTQILTLVHNGTVNIASSVTNTAGTFAINSPSRLDLNILSSGNINTLSRFNASTNTVDDPVMLNGNLMSRSKVNLRRDLGASNNSRIPSEVVKYFNFMPHLIYRYEMANRNRMNYTGLAVFDVQFEYK